MKLDERVRLEIVEILRRGLMNGEDVSQLIRDLDLTVAADGQLRLSDDYLSAQVPVPKID